MVSSEDIPDIDPRPPRPLDEGLDKWRQGVAEGVAPEIEDPLLEQRQSVKQESDQFRRNLDVKQLRKLIIEMEMLDPSDNNSPQRRAEIDAEITKLLDDQADYPNTSHPD